MSNPKIDFNDLFEQAISFPDRLSNERFNNLVGIDEFKDSAKKILALLVNPEGLIAWADKHHNGAKKIINKVLTRPPLIIFEGDVGSGKSELAYTIGDAVARQEKIDITLFPISLSTRGDGMVGQMTKLITASFDYTADAAKKLKSSSSKSRGAVILLIDEADSLAQTRESAQMHHEDRAGVNALIRGIDRLANEKLPAAVIMCTNRISALDPAIKRRAAVILQFSRPNSQQREFVLSAPLTELGFNQKQIDEIVESTGASKNFEYGFTYSDLLQRLLPTIVLDAYPICAVDPKRAIEITKTINPTPPFNQQ